MSLLDNLEFVGGFEDDSDSELKPEPIVSGSIDVQGGREQVAQTAQQQEQHDQRNTTVNTTEPSDNNKFFGDSNYAGDLIDESATPVKDNRYQTLDFQLSVQLLSIFLESIRTGLVKPYQWQTDISVELCMPEKKPTQLEPLKYCLVACNGSGKDSFVIAPFVVWFLLTKIKARAIITSSSGSQLTSQTEQYIKDLCKAVNEQLGAEYFRIRQRYIICRLTGSEVRLFATDEEGKAEGYHPLEPGREMCIIINEAKSVDENIYNALRRCTGYNYWIEVSSPGEPKGFFYHHAIHWENTRKVDHTHCPNHLSDGERLEDLSMYGEHSSYYRSKHLALFTSVSGETILPRETVDYLLENPPPSINYSSKWPLRFGIDLSAGRDETIVYVTRGNRVVKEHAWKEKDTTKTRDEIHRILKDVYKLSFDYEYIYADDGGVGKSIIDMLVEMGWTNIKRIHNQSPAINSTLYGNRGAENWDRVKRLFEEQVFDPRGMSQVTIEQLTSRKVKDKLVGAKMFLQSKKEAKQQGYQSPDRADAFVLSLTGLTVQDFLTELGRKSATEVAAAPKERVFKKTREDQEALRVFYDDNVVYGGFDPNNPMNKQNVSLTRHVPSLRELTLNN